MAEATRRIIRETPVLGGDASVIVYTDHVLLRNKRPAASVNEVNSVIMVVEREMHQIAVNMSSVSTGARIRSFLTHEDPLKWMMGGK